MVGKSLLWLRLVVCLRWLRLVDGYRGGHLLAEFYRFNFVRKF